MADVFIIRNIAEALVEILKSEVGSVIPAANIVAGPPEQAASVSTQSLIVYLYQALENPTLKNVGPAPLPSPPGQPAGAATVRRDPMAVDLFFLLIPAAPPEPVPVFLDTYAILGAAMRAFHDHGIFRLGDWLPTVSAAHKDLKFHLSFNPLSTSQLFELWEAVNEPYRLSVSYVVRTVRIDSKLETDAPRVSERRITVGSR